MLVELSLRPQVADFITPPHSRASRLTAWTRSSTRRARSPATCW
ncbi:MAG: hypothetical protein WDN31_18855 [Hyphomicrobium sp.]